MLLVFWLEFTIEHDWARSYVIRLPDLAHEHELRGDYDGDAWILIVFQVQEFANLLVCVLETFLVHVLWRDGNHCMWEWELIEKDEARLECLRISLVNWIIFPNWSFGLISLLLILPVFKSHFVLDHLLDWQNGEGNVLVGQNVEAVELEWMARLLICRQYLEPNKRVDLPNGHTYVIPVK